MRIKVCNGFKGLCSYRAVVCLMMFTACWVSYMIRVNMSLNILDMVIQAPREDNSSSSDLVCSQSTMTALLPVSKAKYTLKDTAEDSPVDKFDWSTQVQGVILGSYFWGYAITCFPSGALAERWGPRLVVGISTLLSGLLTALCPVAARADYRVLLVCRFLAGACGGVLFPGLHCLISHWAPPAEKGKFISSLMGGTLGTIVTWTLCGALLESSGWPSAFYVPGAIAVAWSIVWIILISDSPAKNRFISEKEKKYILQCIETKQEATKTLPPIKAIFTSIPFLAMAILHVGSNWGLYFQTTSGPSFIAKVLGFNLQAAGILAGLPYLSRLVFSIIFGMIGDTIRARTSISTTMITKIFTIFSHVFPGALLIPVAYVGCNATASVLLLIASLGMNGAATLTSLQNHMDLAPNYAGTLYGIANSAGSVAGFITPSVTAYLTRTGDGFYEWRNVFFVGAAAYFISAIFFIIFGTGVTQPWNEIKDSKPTDKEHGTTDSEK